jgi:DNA-binding response OmpR family regulator
MACIGRYRFGPFEVHTAARQLSKGGTKIKLRGQPYLILEVLLNRAGGSGDSGGDAREALVSRHVR